MWRYDKTQTEIKIDIINEVEIGPKTRQSDRKISPEELKKGQNKWNFFPRKKPQLKIKTGIL